MLDSKSLVFAAAAVAVPYIARLLAVPLLVGHAF
jgi:hypothetical protein